MRVRDIKRRLARRHGYSALKLNRILDKKELITSLAYEEDKLRHQNFANRKRKMMQRGIIWTLVAIGIVILWQPLLFPLLNRMKEIIMINLTVYVDRKKLESHLCWELKSINGIMCMMIMFLLDLMQLWLTVSVFFIMVHY